MKIQPVFLVLTGLPLFGQTSIDNFTAATNDRFANNGAFAGSGFDFSGVGRTFQNDGRWATLIADNIYITANHYKATGNVTFYENNDPSGTSHTRTFAGGMRIGSTDLYLGYFDTPLPTTIARYSFATVDLTGVGLTPVVPQSFAYSTGLTPTTGGYANNDLTNMAVGENRVEFFSEDVELKNNAGSTIATTDSIYTIQNEPGDVGYTYETYESSLNGGDSGSPLLVSDGMDLVLWGIAAGEGTVEVVPGQTRNLSLYSYTGNYDSQIQSFIDANLVAIPEPSAIVLLSLSTGVLFSRRRRNR